MRRIVRCSWWCRRCGENIGSENVALYGHKLPNVVKGSGFFAGMALLDHLRDCQGHDFCEELRVWLGADFLNHPRIWEWFEVHGRRESRLVAEEDVE